MNCKIRFQKERMECKCCIANPYFAAAHLLAGFAGLYVNSTPLKDYGRMPRPSEQLSQTSPRHLMKRMSASFSQYPKTIGCPCSTFCTGWSITMTCSGPIFLSPLFSRLSNKAVWTFFPTMQCNSMISKACASAVVALSR